MTPLEEETIKVGEMLQPLAQLIDKEILPVGWGFALMAFPFGEGGRMLYVSNGRREDVVRSMYEFIERTKEGWGVDQPDETEAKEDTRLGRALQRVAELEGEIAKLKGTR